MKVKKGRNSQISRVISLLDIFEGATGGLTVAELHERLSDRGHEIGRRTIYRDLEALSKAGFPVFPEGEEGINQRFTLDRKTRIPDYLAFTSKELFALFMARGALQHLRSSPFHPDLEGAFQKLEEYLGLKQVRHLAELESEIRFHPGPEWGAGVHPEVLETLRAACAERQVLECVYHSASSKQKGKRRLGPHYLCYSKGSLYLVAEDLGDLKVKLFAVPRMEEAQMSSEAYEGCPNEPSDLFDGSFGIHTSGPAEEVEIEFLPEAAPYVRERKWHSSQKLKALPDGKLRLSLKVSIDRELMHWVLSFGPRARAIGPEPLVGQLKELIEAMREGYN